MMSGGVLVGAARGGSGKSVMGLSALLRSMKSPREWSLQSRLQMVAWLPAGGLVDSELVGLLSSSGLARVRGPAPSWLSPAGVRRVLDLCRSSIPLGVPEVLVGLQDPDSVAVLAASADCDWLRWMVHLNPVSRQLSALPPVPAPMSVRDSVEVEQLLVETVWSEGMVQRLTPGAREVVSIFSDRPIRGWNSCAPAPASTGERLDVWSRPPSPQLNFGGTGYESLESIVSISRTASSVSLSGGGSVFFSPDWGSVLRVPEWRSNLMACPLACVGLPRQMGRELFEACGGSFSAWSVGLELLDGVSGSVDDWLEIVRSIA